MWRILREPHTIKDGLNLIKKALKFQRFSNAIAIYFSFKKSTSTGNVQIKGQPISISFEPTTSCNLRCPQCPSGLRSFSRDTGILDKEMYHTFIAENYQTLLYLLLYFQGEPYLHPHFFELVKIASNKSIYVSTSTNAHYLNPENAIKTVESGLDRLIISIDGVSQESFEKYRIGGSLEKVISGTKNLIEARKKLKKKGPFIIWQFIVFKHNETQVGEIKKLGKSIGVDQVAIKTAQIYDKKGAEDLLPENPKYRRYKNTNLVLKKAIKNECWKMWHSAVVTWDGNVVPCCFDKDAIYQLGNIKQEPFAEIWQNTKYKTFRKTLWKGRKFIPICTNCSEGAKVWEL